MKTLLIRLIPASLTIAALGLPSAFAQSTERVSVDSLGFQGNDHSLNPAISADGRYVAFDSEARNLVPGDTNGAYDIFVHDRQTGLTTRVSVDSLGVQGNDHSLIPAISADGRFVAFDSEARTLVPGDTNFASDVIVHDCQTGQTTRVSVSSVGVQGNGGSYHAAISTDGRYVAFNSAATNLVPGDTNSWEDVFVHDRQTGQTTRVSVDSLGVQGNGFSATPAISADGRYVAFNSDATNLVPGDTNSDTDIFVHDRQTGQTTRVSVDSLGVQGNDPSYYSAISADGSFVAFESYATNLVPGDTNGWSDVFVHDRQTGQTTRVSVDSLGVQGNYKSYGPAIATDGRTVAFSSDATNLVPGDTNGRDVFVHDRQTGQTTRVSVDTAGVQGNNDSDNGFISADGRYVAFKSKATNLVPGDTNGKNDIFVHDRGASGPSLAKTGTCPGVMTISATNCTPNAPAAFLYGVAGSYTKPNGTCAGVTLSISSPTLAAVLTSNGSGAASVTYNFPAGLCGRTVQIVDVATCTTSNTITL